MLGSGGMRCLSVVVLAACTSVRSVPREELLPIAQRQVGNALVVHTMEHWKSRLDPTSKIRFFTKDHQPTDWLAADELRIGNGWIYVPAVVDVLDYTERITIRGLDKPALDDLAAARPLVGTALEITEDGSAIVQARGNILRTWVDHFIDGVAIRLAPNNLQNRRANLVDTLAGAPLGTWTFELTRYGALTASGPELFERLGVGLGTLHGWRFRDVAYAQIEDYSGTKTYGLVWGTAALLAYMAVTGTRRLEIDIGTEHPPGTWKPELADARNRIAPLLFTSRAVRHTQLAVSAQAEVAVDAFGATQFFEGGAATVRLFQGLELGAGGGHLGARTPSGLWSGGLAFARFGGNFPVDAAQRYWLPLTMDIGGGGGEALGAFWRLRTGVQRRITDHAFVGAALTPAYLNWKHGGPSRDTKSWTLSAGVEAGVTF